MRTSSGCAARGCWKVSETVAGTPAGPTPRLVRLGGELRARGVQAGVGDLLTAHRALAGVDPASRDEAYFALRAALCSRHSDLAPFAEAFAACFGSGSAAPAWTPEARE